MKLFKYDVDISLGYDGGFIALPLSLSYSGMEISSADTWGNLPEGTVPEGLMVMKAWVLRVFCFYLMVEAYREGK